MKKIAIVGSGTIAAATARLIAKKCGTYFACNLIARNSMTAQSICSDVLRDYGLLMDWHECDALDRENLARLLRWSEIELVINLATPDTHLQVMGACLDSGCHYLDTALFEAESDFNVSPPWYQPEKQLKSAFSEAGLTALLSIGFDPGIVNCFCAKAQKDDFDEILEIDLLCANNGTHGHFFATNFNPSVNLKELCEETSYREGGNWHTSPAFSRSRRYCLPGVGEHLMYSVGHEEVHSLAEKFPNAAIEFWMRIGDQFRQTLQTLERIGLVSRDKILVRDVQVAPIDVLAALMPEPFSLATTYKGQVCVAVVIKGRKQNVTSSMIYYSVCSHEACIEDIGAHVTAYTTAVPAVAAAQLILEGHWNTKTLVHPEDLEPDLFLKRICDLGMSWRSSVLPTLPTNGETINVDVEAEFAQIVA
ncbi:saccharopine dehydrogenase C-terminal domain-containing protein [Pseudomonas sp. M47T1]|uniref:saccharopine dehydrogenase C-terminal domain-containing protein n=1 Tax=Pseudomonas sp. M47T1 TaxID=1179778 RepID=UPI0002EEE997|nr:saccharopine dehydrogenase C-terminal domain-containing protein [Pseudomonas sp. M47T1]